MNDKVVTGGELGLQTQIDGELRLTEQVDGGAAIQNLVDGDMNLHEVVDGEMSLSNVIDGDGANVLATVEKDYNNLSHKPSINGVELIGNQTSEGLGIVIPTVPVTSVNNKTGDVVLDASDVGALPDSTKYALGERAGGHAVVTNGILYGEVDSTSTSTAFTAQIVGVTEYYDGLTIFLRNGVVTSASGFTIDINGLGAKGSYSNMTTGNPITPTAPTRDTTIFNINYTMLFIYSESLVEGGAWICVRGYDSNTNTIGYQLRTNSMSLPMDSVVYRYRIMFTSADGSKFVPANNSTSTNATAKRDVVQTKIDPFGAIVYYGYTTSIAAGSRPGATYLWQQYTLTLGYSFNRTGAALTLTSWKPIYIKCAPQTDGSVIIDATTPYVQALPSTYDGKVYIYLGVAYSATAVEMTLNHPVYYIDSNGRKRVWTGESI